MRNRNQLLGIWMLIFEKPTGNGRSALGKRIITDAKQIVWGLLTPGKAFGAPYDGKVPNDPYTKLMMQLLGKNNGMLPLFTCTGTFLCIDGMQSIDVGYSLKTSSANSLGIRI